jgi:hypothetical protein
MKRHRPLRIAAGLLGALLLAFTLGLAAFWPHDVPRAVPGAAAAVRAAPDYEDTGDRVERLTQERLTELEDRLALELAAERSGPGGFAMDLRTAAIGLSMWGPLGDLSQSTLTALGDHAWLRRTLFFGMPLVRWMSAPFLFPVDLPSSDAASDADFAPLIGLVEHKTGVGMGVSLDNVGDASLSAEDAAAYRDYYAGLIRAYGRSGAGAPLHVSLKLSALVHDLPAALDGPDNSKRAEIRDALRELLATGKDVCPAGLFVRIDMEEHVYKELSLSVFRDLVEREPKLVRDADGQLRIGIVTQAYLRDSAHDLAGLADWARAQGVRVPVRLVKGAYEGYEKDLAMAEGRKSPVWDFKPSTDANFEALAEYLLRSPDAFQPVFATHNLRTQARVMALAKTLGRPKSRLEIQMLYGMGDPIKRAVVGLGFGLREYVPAGPLNRGLKYAGRRFHELANPDNALARTLHGDFTVLADQPGFQGDEDRADGAYTLALVKEARGQGKAQGARLQSLP